MGGGGGPHRPPRYVTAIMTPPDSTPTESIWGSMRAAGKAHSAPVPPSRQASGGAAMGPCVKLGSPRVSSFHSGAARKTSADPACRPQEGAARPSRRDPASAGNSPTKGFIFQEPWAAAAVPILQL